MPKGKRCLGLVTFGPGLLNVPGIVMSIFIGVMLISVIAMPRIITQLRNRFAPR
jgi:rhamnose transport system permease protein